MTKKKTLKCPFCKGSGRIPYRKTIRRRCEDCSDHGHGCFGSGRKDGLGYEHCVSYKD